ncbi:MAG TPA: sugar ABC transporter permease [Gaiellaceae bacterium]|nr:sugar ABC transporter permease [Gaiellaceae bacterium]
MTLARAVRWAAPYLLILPVVAIVVAILGYPLYHLARLSFQKYGLFELIAHHGTSVGWANYRSVLHDQIFWHVLVRTIVFTVANVGLTMGIGTLLALLLTKVSSFVRVLLTAGLVLAWSIPPVVAVQVWLWMTDRENGVLNYTLTRLHVGNYFQHDWYATPFSQLSLTTSLIVWGAIPFVVVTVYAGLTQVPTEIVEAAEIDGARPWRIFWDVTVPIIKPIFLILTSLSIIWDFAVFTQPFLLIGQPAINTSNELMGIYLFEEGYLKTDFGRGAAISILMLLIVAVLSIVYVRKMVRAGDEAQ